MDELRIPDEEETEEIQSEVHQLKAARLRIEDVIKSGANWYFIIAVLSLINTIIMVAGGQTRFVVGLGITSIFDAIGTELGGPGVLIALLLSILVAVLFIIIGVFARKRHMWAFIVGMVLYGFDGLLLLLLKDIWSLAFHALALYFIFKGVKALNVYEKIERKGYIPPHTM